MRVTENGWIFQMTFQINYEQWISTGSAENWALVSVLELIEAQIPVPKHCCICSTNLIWDPSLVGLNRTMPEQGDCFDQMGKGEEWCSDPEPFWNHFMINLDTVIFKLPFYYWYPWHHIWCNKHNYHIRLPTNEDIKTEAITLSLIHSNYNFIT